MKIKTSLSLSEELITRIDELSGRKNRSEFVEKALLDYLERQMRKERDMKDLAIINKKAGKLNEEAEDVLSYQAGL
jgi:metal-responsive CopG/Arc/MetJ family transcriptional regulator